MHFPRPGEGPSRLEQLFGLECPPLFTPTLPGAQASSLGASFLTSPLFYSEDASASAGFILSTNPSPATPATTAVHTASPSSIMTKDSQLASLLSATPTPYKAARRIPLKYKVVICNIIK